MEQNWGPHMEQKRAVFDSSAGSFSSWNAIAVSGSRTNWSCHRNSNRALGRAWSRMGAPAWHLVRSASVGGDLVGDGTGLHLVAVGEPEVFLGGDVAQRGGPVRSDQGGAHGRGDVVVAGGDVRDERAKCVEGRAVAPLPLQADVFPDEVRQRDGRDGDADVSVGQVVEPTLGMNFGHNCTRFLRRHYPGRFDGPSGINLISAHAMGSRGGRVRF